MNRISPTRSESADRPVTSKPAPASPLPADAPLPTRSVLRGGPRPPVSAIDLHINELVLHGFSPADRQPIADAIERELSSLLTREGLSVDRSFDLEFFNGGSFRAEARSRHESAGASVARAIYGGLRR